MKCKFARAWSGRCNKKTDKKYCLEHLSKKCKVCGTQATRECSCAVSLVCGAPLC
ncbi:unnamed protein product, partial [marine sediment metagenome]